MTRLAQATCAALTIAGALVLAGPAPAAKAQRSTPRPAVGTNPRPVDRFGAEREEGRLDERERRDDERRHGGRHRGSGGVIYLPADGDILDPQQSGLYFPQSGVYVAPGVYRTQGVAIGPGVYSTQGGSGMAYDAYGRPMLPSYAMAGGGGGGYTPDLSGTPYVVTANGMMLADMPNGEQRSFASCAADRASRDPSGKPRTIFYQPTDYGLVLREGQRGRVQGSPPTGTTACYGIDQFGRVALLY